MTERESTPMLYFAYGSNLHPLRLRNRVPSAVVEGVARLDGRRLAFHKRGYSDGSGKCDVPEAASESCVYGALFRLTAEDWRRLKAIEGDGVGYRASAVAVGAGNGRVSCLTFIARRGFVDPDLAPVDWYQALVVEGAKFHRLPADYVAAIEALPSVEDPDRERSARNWELVREMRPPAQA